ncbi:hypothetical protein HJFPF1_09494 [Paramyrothecium foliicola]|nr:hypothetical protein HJFPF1_09494 [Paramyrothecium foliicola]
MEHALKLFPDGLPTLEQVRKFNVDSTVPSDTAWIWGKDDEIGRVNLLTPERLLVAKQNEVQDGNVISLNWSMKLPAKPAFGRKACQHRFEKHPDGHLVYDDWIDMNIQSGSQWDGFRHFGHQAQKRIYNNVTEEDVNTGTKCGIQALSNHGIVGRGILLDYYGWKVRKGEPYDPLTSHPIHLEELLQVANDQKVEFQQGDILLIRSGYTSAYYEYQRSDPGRLDEAGTNTPNLAGVAQTEEMKTWLHDSYFSAVAGDAPAFECWPPKEWYLHEFLLGLWGVPIGEMFDLEALAEQCLQKKRWSFMFMSTPFNMPGGIASLANALAVQ